jgi:integrase/recombinase XerD
MATENSPAGADGSELVGEFVRIYKRGKTWYANFQADKKQERQSLKTSNKKLALRRALKIDAQLSAGQWKATPDAATVEEAITAYRDFLRAEGRAAKTLSKYEKVFERIADLAQARRIRDLSGVDLKFVDAYRRIRVDDGAAPKTHYTETVVVRQLVNFALTRDMIASDPLKGLRLKKPKPTRQPCWTHEQVMAILASSPPEVKPAFTLLAEFGLRFGELAWLTWLDIDFGINVLKIQPKDGWKPKSGDQRAVPLNPVAIEILGELPKQWKWVVTMPPSKHYSKWGRQWTERRLLFALKQVLKKVGLEGKLHTFRHSFISNALLKGTAVAVVREWVGHVDDQIIRHYTHVHNAASQTAMQRLAQANLYLQKKEKPDESARTDSAQIQHTEQESGDAIDAK